MDPTSQITSNERLYQHTPLREHTSIRLLSLLPGQHGTPLKCDITEYEDSSIASYEALSYTWGEPEFPKVIHVSDSSGRSQYIRVTQNLYNALQRLRKVDIPRSMWIDALCIDQADLQEKGHQVAHMGQIFKRADRVVIWLGDTDDFPYFENWVEHFITMKHNEYKPKDRYGFLKIPWFHRVWTVQEFVLAENTCFCLGRLEVPAGKMEGMITGAIIDSEDDPLGFNSLFLYRDQIRGSFSVYRRGVGNIPPVTLSECFLNLARRRQCKDGRDRIYGMLGLVPDAGMLPDYSLSLKQVYMNFAAAALRSGDFSVLHVCSLEHVDHSMPSYVPGIENPDYTGIPRDRHYRVPFRAGLNRQIGFDIDANGYLCLMGIRIGVVQTRLDLTQQLESIGEYYKLVMTYLLPGPDESLAWQKDLEATTYLVEGHSYTFGPRTRHPIYTGQTWFKVILRTLLMDDPINRYLDFDHPMSSYDKRKFADRSLFQTKTGFLGLGPCHLQPGDEVVTFEGDYTPFVLRPRSNTNNPKGNIYKIVGDCYLHGWMYDTFPDETVGGPPNRFTGPDSEPKQAFIWVSGREGTQHETLELDERTFTIC